MLLCAGAVITGCADVPAHQRPAQTGVTQPGETARTPEAAPQPRDGAGSYVEQLFADPRLDPIRDKVPLVLRSGAVTPLLLANQDKPTPPEKQAIKVWLSVREQAQQYQLEHRGPPSQLLVRTRQQVTRAILQLYNGEMTYGEFAKRIQVLDSEYQAAARSQ
jgi:O6-methylguanine-DNA--protein-cysteine methyltransferase